jgi:hypothetical protein
MSLAEELDYLNNPVEKREVVPRPCVMLMPTIEPAGETPREFPDIDWSDMTARAIGIFSALVVTAGFVALLGMTSIPY